MAFATSTHLLLQYDSRRCRELASDTGTPISEGAVATSPVILWVLERATEMILMACRTSEAYTEEELQTLADSSTQGHSIRGLTVDLAYGLLCLRRGTGAADMDRLSPAYGQALRTLKMLEEGNLIFARIDGEPQADAGTPRTADLTQQTTTPIDSWSALATRSLLPSRTPTWPNS